MMLQDHLKGVDPDIAKIILAVANGARTVKEGFMDRQGQGSTQNVYGEVQMEMDTWADTVFAKVLKGTGVVRSLASEEQEEIVGLSDEGTFSVTIDPLDGSSLMGVNLTVGTIVGIYRSNHPMNAGRDMSGACYVLYGPLTVLVYTIGAGVHEFSMNKDGQFVLQKENLTIGKEKIYSPGALRKEYLPQHKKIIERLESEGYKLRFCGSFVADVHQIIHKGGMFTYPAYEGKPNGKLRLLFEADPMGFIVRNAGGAVSNGRKNILDIQPEKLHQRVPIYIGGKYEISLVEEEWGKEC